MNQKLNDAFKKIMDESGDIEDTEIAHLTADELLCQLLEKLGYKEVTESFRKIKKWYA